MLHIKNFDKIEISRIAQTGWYITSVGTTTDTYVCAMRDMNDRKKYNEITIYRLPIVDPTTKDLKYKIQWTATVSTNEYKESFASRAVFIQLLGFVIEQHLEK